MPTMKFWDGQQWIMLDAKNAETVGGVPVTDLTPISHVGSGGDQHAAATPTTAGFMTGPDKAKMDTIAQYAEVNQNAFSTVDVRDETDVLLGSVAADLKTDTVTFKEGPGITLIPSATTDTITIAVDSNQISSLNHNHDDRYLQLVGGQLTGELSINKSGGQFINLKQSDYSGGAYNYISFSDAAGAWKSYIGYSSAKDGHFRINSSTGDVILTPGTGFNAKVNGNNILSVGSFPTSGGSNGTAVTPSRSDHNHDAVYMKMTSGVFNDLLSIKTTSNGLTRTILQSLAGDSTGMGISITGGGTTVIGAGESAHTLLTEQGLGGDGTPEVMYVTSDSNVQVKTNMNSGTGAAQTFDFKTDGSLDVPNIVTGKQLKSTIATGTAPLIITSTTAVTNLNADMVDGIQGSNIAKLDTANTFTNGQTITHTNGLTLKGSSGDIDSPKITFQNGSGVRKGDIRAGSSGGLLLSSSGATMTLDATGNFAVPYKITASSYGSTDGAVDIGGNTTETTLISSKNIFNFTVGYGGSNQRYMRMEAALNSVIFRANNIRHVYEDSATGNLRVEYTDGSPAPVTAKAFNTVSSAGMKKDIQAFTTLALDKVVATPVHTYLYKTELDTAPRSLGLIVEESPTEIVTDGKYINQYAMSSLLWKAVQELAAENADLRTALIDLTARVEALEG